MPALTKSATALAAVLLTIPVLASCGGGEDSKGATSSEESTDTEPTSTGMAEDGASGEDTTAAAPTDTDFGKPAKGAKIKGRGYTYRIPRSWSPRTKAAKSVQKSIDTAAGESEASDGFEDNVLVNFDKAEADTTLEELAASVPDQLGKVVDKLDVRPDVVVDGRDFTHHRGRVVKGPSKYFLDQFVSINESGRITIVTFSFSPDLAKGPRVKVVNSVMASWKWAT